MKKIFRFLLLFLIPFMLLSCETDFDVIADYKEVAIVYGLLNQNDSVHYIRINKAFLGNGNALTYAQVADSSTFGANVNVILTETSATGAFIRDIVFDTVTLSNKTPGDFYSPNQLFYYSTATLNQENTYELKVTHKTTDYEMSGQTRLVNLFSVTKPSSGAKTMSFKRTITQPNKFAWTNAINGKRYQLRFQFNFKELTLSGDTLRRKIDWVFAEKTSEKIDGTGESDVSYTNEEFFTVCESKIPYSDLATEENIAKRFASTCVIEVTAIGDEFNTYLEANGPSTGVLMEKPLYTNITNGYGLLSSRLQIQRSILLNSETILDLALTTQLKFAKPTK